MSMRVRLYTTTRRGAAVLSELLLLRIPPPHDLVVDVVTVEPSPIEPDYMPELRAVVARNFERSRLVGVGYVWALPDPDLILCSNWRTKLRADELNSARLGALVIHDSLLPKYRGFSPLVHAILNGDSVTGATMFVPTEEIDAGPVVGQVEINIAGESIGAATARMTDAYRALVRKYVPHVLSGGRVVATPQVGTPTIAPRIDWATAPEVDPTWPDERIDRHCRAFAPPYPRAFVRVGSRKVYLT